VIRQSALWLMRLSPTSAELVLAGGAIVFGLALLNPVDLSLRSPAFRQLSEMAPQTVWAGVWLLLGVLQAIGAVYGVGRRQADVSVAALWLFWTVVQLLAMGLTVGPFTYGWLVVASLIASHLERQRGTV
jgi:hypothetical protein